MLFNREKSSLPGKVSTFILFLAFLVFSMAPVYAQEESFKIGACLSFSGPYGVLGDVMREGALLAVKENGGKILGRKVEFIWEDTETKPQVGVQKANKLIARDIDLLFGAVSSAVTSAVSQVAKIHKVPQLVTASADPAITGSEGHRYLFRTSNNTNMENLMALEFAKSKGYKSIIVMTMDYKAARITGEKFMELAKREGIEIKGAVYPPLGEKDYALYISKCLNSGADAVYAVVAGSDSVTFLKQADGVKLKEKMDIFGPVLLSLLSAKAVGNAAVGVYTGVRYSFTYDCPANKAFVESYKKEYGTIPNMFAGEAYDGVKMFIKAIEKSGSMDKEKWINSLEGFKYTESVEGIKVMRKCDHQALQIGLFAEIVKSPDFPDPYPKVIKVFPPEKVHRPCGKAHWW